MSYQIPGADRMQARTFCDLLRARACHQPDLAAFTFPSASGDADDSLSYAELDRQARVIAVALGERAARSERALLIFPPGPAYIAALFGCFYAGVVAVPVYPPRASRGMDRLRSIVADAEASLVLTDATVQAGMS